MNREILFRGKRVDNGEWVEGDFCHSKNQTYIHPGHNSFNVSDTGLSKIIVMHKIDPTTIGQYTGLTDKNGKRIFEGDLITIPKSKRQGLPAPVMWSKNDAKFEIRRRGFNSIPFDEEWGVYEIVGNIHDNYELPEGE